MKHRPETLAHRQGEGSVLTLPTQLMLELPPVPARLDPEPQATLDVTALRWGAMIALAVWVPAILGVLLWWSR